MRVKRTWGVATLLALFVAPIWSQPPLPSRAATNSLPPGDPVNLALDDGVMDQIVSFGVGEIFFNQFSPTEYPLELDRLSVLWPPEGMQIGDAFWLFLYEDPDGNIPNGTTHRATFQSSVAAIDGVTFTVVEFAPVQFNGPGDILIAIAVKQLGAVALDLTAPQQRSWVVNWDGTMPPPIPSSGLGIVTNLNWMIRGAGTVLVPVGLQSFSVE